MAIALVANASVLIGRSQRLHPRSALPAPELRLDGAIGPRFAGEVLSQRRGYFAGRAQGLIVTAAAGDAGFIRNITRDGAIGVTSGQKFLLAAWAGEPVVAFGASFLDTPTVIVTRKAAGLRYPADLVGKRIACAPRTEHAVIFDALVAQLRLPRSQLTQVELPDGYAALERGEVDAVVTGIDDAALLAGVQRGAYHLIRPQDYGIHVPGLVYFAAADIVRDEPSLVQDVLSAALKGWDAVYADLDGTTVALADLAGEGPAADGFRQALQLQRDLIRPTATRIGDFDPSRWATLRDILLFARLGDEKVPLSTAVTYDVVREVYRRGPAGDVRDPPGGGPR